VTIPTDAETYQRWYTEAVEQLAARLHRAVDDLTSEAKRIGPTSVTDVSPAVFAAETALNSWQWALANARPSDILRHAARLDASTRLETNSKENI
jgi:hypothetical protein